MASKKKSKDKNPAVAGLTEVELEQILALNARLEKIVEKIDNGEELSEKDKVVLAELKKEIEKRLGPSATDKESKERKQRELIKALSEAYSQRLGGEIAYEELVYEKQKKIALLCMSLLGVIGAEAFSAILIGAKSKAGPFYNTCPLTNDLKNAVALKIFNMINLTIWLHIVQVTYKEFYHIKDDKPFGAQTVPARSHAVIKATKEYYEKNIKEANGISIEFKNAAKNIINKLAAVQDNLKSTSEKQTIKVNQQTSS